MLLNLEIIYPVPGTWKVNSGDFYLDDGDDNSKVIKPGNDIYKSRMWKVNLGDFHLDDVDDNSNVIKPGNDIYNSRDVEGKFR